MKPLRVLIVTHNYPTRSSERRNAGIFVHDFAKELVKNGIEVYVFCPSANKNINKVEGIPVYWFVWGKNNKSLKDLKLWNPYDLIDVLILFFRGIKESLSYANKIKPDYCISMWAVPSGVFTYFIKKKFNVPYGIWVLGSDIYVYAKFPIFGQIIKNVLKNANHLLSDGFDLSRKVAKMTGRKCFFLPSGTNFAENIKLRKQRKSIKQTILTFVGRIEPEKGPDILVDTIASLPRKVQSKLKVNIIGDGSMLEDLKNKVDVHNLNSIKFYGNIDDKDQILNILYNSDWLVIPSRSDSIPLVFSESMKAGTPIITAALSDLKYLVDKYKVGLYFEPNSTSSLRRVLSNLPAKKKRDIMARNTSKAAENFKLKTSVKRFLELVQ